MPDPATVVLEGSAVGVLLAVPDPGCAKDLETDGPSRIETEYATRVDVQLDDLQGCVDLAGVAQVALREAGLADVDPSALFTTVACTYVGSDAPGAGRVDQRAVPLETPVEARPRAARATRADGDAGAIPSDDFCFTFYVPRTRMQQAQAAHAARLWSHLATLARASGVPLSRKAFATVASPPVCKRVLRAVVRADAVPLPRTLDCASVDAIVAAITTHIADGCARLSERLRSTGDARRGRSHISAQADKLFRSRAAEWKAASGDRRRVIESEMLAKVAGASGEVGAWRASTVRDAFKNRTRRTPDGAARRGSSVRLVVTGVGRS